MLARITIGTIAVASLLLPTTATAALDASRDAATGAIRITATAGSAERVVLDRSDDGQLRIADAASAATSADATCTIDAAGAATCPAPAGTTVTLTLGDGADTLDARLATAVALSVDSGAGADRLRLGAAGMAVATSPDALDTVDLTHADGEVRVRYEAALRALVARCGECSLPWAVTLPASPAAIALGAADDDVDLTTWPGRGRTSWALGAGRDRFFGARVRRSVVDGGDDGDELLSRAPADTLLGGRGTDKIVDFGGSGDVLRGGADIDAMASLDGGADTIDGGSGRDMCPSLRRERSTCDTSGRVRSFEMSIYLPVPTEWSVRQVIGIR